MTERIRATTSTVRMTAATDVGCVVMFAERLTSFDDEPSVVYTTDGKTWRIAAAPFASGFGNRETGAVCWTGDRFLSDWDPSIRDLARAPISSFTGATFLRIADPDGFFEDGGTNAMAANGEGMVVIVGDDFLDAGIPILISHDFGASFAIPGASSQTPTSISMPDNIADAYDAGSSLEWSITSPIDTSTVEPGEDVPNGSGDHTIWIKWTSPPGDPLTVTIDTLGSYDPDTGDGFMDTVLAIYEDPVGDGNIADLVLIDDDDDDGPGYNSSMTTILDDSTIYYIQAGTYDDSTPGYPIVVNMRTGAVFTALGEELESVAVAGDSIFVTDSDLDDNGAAISTDAGLSWSAVNTTGIDSLSDAQIHTSGGWIIGAYSSTAVIWRSSDTSVPPTPVMTPWSHNYPPAIQGGFSHGGELAPQHFAKGGSDGRAILTIGFSYWTGNRMLGSSDGGYNWVEIGHISDQPFAEAGFDLLPVLPDEWEDELVLNGAAWGFGYWWVSNYRAGQFPSANAPYILRGSEDFTEWVGVFPPGLHDTRPGPMIGNT